MRLLVAVSGHSCHLRCLAFGKSEDFVELDMPYAFLSSRRVFLLPALGLLGACVGAKFIPTGAAYPAKDPDCTIEVYSAGPPDRAFEELGVLEANGGWGKASLEDVLPKLEEEACIAGGDALVLQSAHRYESRTDGWNTTSLFAVATVIRWTDGL